MLTLHEYMLFFVSFGLRYNFWFLWGMRLYLSLTFPWCFGPWFELKNDESILEMLGWGLL